MSLYFNVDWFSSFCKSYFLAKILEITMISIRHIISGFVIAATIALGCGSTAWASKSQPLFKEFTLGQSMAELRKQTMTFRDCSEEVGISGALCRKETVSFFNFSDWEQFLVGDGDQLVTVSLIRKVSPGDMVTVASSLAKSGYTLSGITDGTAYYFDFFKTAKENKLKDIAEIIKAAEQSAMSKKPFNVIYVFFDLKPNDILTSKANNLASFIMQARPDMRYVELNWVEQDDAQIMALSFRVVGQQQQFLKNAGTKEQF